VGAIFVNNCITELRHNAILQNVGISPGSPPYCAVLTYGGISVAMLDNVVNLNSGYGVVLHDPITYQIEYNDVFDNSSEDYHTESWSADPGASITNISVDPELLAPEFLPQPGSPVEAAASDGGHIGLDSATAPRSPDAAPPVCGNGTLEIGEQCDDGNAQSGDGCSGSCYFECIIVLAGDVNVSGKITSADIIGLLGYIFKGGVQPLPCPAAGDVNCDGSITTADIIALIVFVFKGGAPPCNACSSPLAGQC
jgi:cysteine-rich repeat protein